MLVDVSGRSLPSTFFFFLSARRCISSVYHPLALPNVLNRVSSSSALLTIRSHLPAELLFRYRRTDSLALGLLPIEYCALNLCSVASLSPCFTSLFKTADADWTSTLRLCFALVVGTSRCRAVAPFHLGQAGVERKEISPCPSRAKEKILVSLTEGLSGRS